MHVSTRIVVEGLLDRAKALPPDDFFLDVIHTSYRSDLNPGCPIYYICMHLGNLFKLFKSQMIMYKIEVILVLP